MKPTQCKVIAIVAMDEGRVIGKNNSLPWHIPEDLKRFSALTRGHTVLMGRNTYDSLPDRFKPLPSRNNVVVSTRKHAEDFPKEVELVRSATHYIEQWKANPANQAEDKLWIIGGASIYEGTKPFWDEVYLTLVKGRYDGDVYMSAFEEDFTLVEEETYPEFKFLRYERKNI